MKQITWLSPQDPPEYFPPVERALDDPQGLLAGGGDLSPERLLAAYARGIFPWYSAGQPVLWWAPDPREVLFIDELHVSRSLVRTLKAKRFRVSRDEDFDAVIAGCAAPRVAANGTWITSEMADAYRRLHALGAAHSIETWQDGELVGGLYGVEVGRIFCGESMFSRRPDASKVAFVELVQRCRDRGIVLVDCQLPSPHLRSLGSRPIPRTEFTRLLSA